MNELYVGSVQYVVSLLSASLCYFLTTRLVSFNIIFMFVFLFCIFVFYFVHSMLLCCLCIVSLFVYSCLFPFYVQVYRLLPPEGNPTAVNIYIISYPNNNDGTLYHI